MIQFNLNNKRPEQIRQGLARPGSDHVTLLNYTHDEHNTAHATAPDEDALKAAVSAIAESSIVRTVEVQFEPNGSTDQAMISALKQVDLKHKTLLIPTFCPIADAVISCLHEIKLGSLNILVNKERLNRLKDILPNTKHLGGLEISAFQLNKSDFQSLTDAIHNNHSLEHVSARVHTYTKRGTCESFNQNVIPVLRRNRNFNEFKSLFADRSEDFLNNRKAHAFVKSFLEKMHSGPVQRAPRGGNPPSIANNEVASSLAQFLGPKEGIRIAMASKPSFQIAKNHNNLSHQQVRELRNLYEVSKKRPRTDNA
ncbi:MAG TPA: hypothetical protein VFX23_01975 [Limnobacter sp.]|uniref:hypothetical protein n=1 Tax=Limnobacter sp. TaxID=2003368 RepID=UPI002E35F849|nr:hypothetical protein [Limnobacter sp.]HEX5484741.1 hypothetical protein [Limnobacter sp.]